MSIIKHKRPGTCAMYWIKHWHHAAHEHDRGCWRKLYSILSWMSAHTTSSCSLVCVVPCPCWIGPSWHQMRRCFCRVPALPRPLTRAYPVTCVESCYCMVCNITSSIVPRGTYFTLGMCGVSYFIHVASRYKSPCIFLVGNINTCVPCWLKISTRVYPLILASHTSPRPTKKTVLVCWFIYLVDALSNQRTLLLREGPDGVYALSERTMWWCCQLSRCTYIVNARTHANLYACVIFVCLWHTSLHAFVFPSLLVQPACWIVSSWRQSVPCGPIHTPAGWSFVWISPVICI